MNAPLLATCDTDLLDDLLRLAAAAGVSLDIAHDPATALRSWSSAPVVLVGPDLAPALAAHSPTRRPDVFLLSLAEPDYKAAVELGADRVLALPQGEPWLVQALADTVDGKARQAPVVGFVGGGGGVGTTSLAAATALVAARDRVVTLLDLDPLGPGIERVLDLSGGLTWHGLDGAEGRLGSRALRTALPQRDGVAVLGWGSSPVGSPLAWRPALDAARRGSDLVILDLPRGGALDELLPVCDHIVLLAAGSVMGVASAMRLAQSRLAVSPSALLAVREAAVVPGDVSAALGLPLAAVVEHDRRLAENVELGLGPVSSKRSPLAAAARAILEVVA